MYDQEMAQKKIDGLRSELDALDEKLVGLLNDRATIALKIRALKPDANYGLYDPKREEEIFTHIARINQGPLYAENLREIYGAILREMKEMRG